MLKFRKAIFTLPVVLFAFFFESSVSAQCGPGKISHNVSGFGSILTENFAFSNGLYALGAPDGNGANFSSGGQYITIDLIDTVRAGQTYSIIWRQYPGQSGTSYLNWSESVDGATFTIHPSSGIGTDNETYFNTEIIASSDTRFIKIFSSSTYDLSIDAVSYNAIKCYSDNCASGYASKLNSGNGLPLVSSDQNGVTSYTYLSGVPDGRSAYFNSSGDWAIINFPFTIPAGQKYYIIWRPVDIIGVAKSTISVEESDGTGWGSPRSLTAYTGESPVFITEVVTAAQNTSRIRVSLASGSDYFYIDAVIFSYPTCDPPAPDLDVSGNFEFCGSPVQIAPGLSISDPANQIIYSAYAQIGNGFQPGQDFLSITSAYGITGTYLSARGLLVLKGPATASQYQAVLRTMVYNNSNPTPTTGIREILISLERMLPETGHFYRYVPVSGLTWHLSVLYAERTNLFGMQGYLANVTSAGENSFLTSQMTGGAIWIGASYF